MSSTGGSLKPQPTSPLGQFTRNSITLKVLSIGFLVLLLLIPTLMIQDLIEERQFRRDQTIGEISSKWGRSQYLNGPVLTVPYRAYYKNEKDEIVTTIEHAHFLPEQLNVNGEVTAERRYRGIYEVAVYNSTLELEGKFGHPNFTVWDIEADDILWKQAFFSLGISDMRGIQENISIQWNQKELEVTPTIGSQDLGDPGISARVPLHSATDSSGEYQFQFSLDVNGSESLQFTPVGKETNVKLASAWPNPSFSGEFIPDEREIGDDGFSASWRIFHLNRNFPQQWTGSSYSPRSAYFGVFLRLPVDQYQKSMRSAKYAVMIIALTFLIYFFVEILNKKRIHPFQYILVGLSLCIFYTLLISLSEHMNFNFAYLLSSVAIIGLVTAYSAAIFSDRRLTALVGAILSVLYIFIFVTLQLQDYALLMGSVGLFVIMATVMYLSRKIDWYTIATGEKAQK